MPELPEVETVARTLYPHLRDTLFKSAKLLRPDTLHPLSMPLETLSGMKTRGVRRRGKLLIIDLNPSPERSPNLPAPQYLVAHLRMTGRLFTREANADQGKHCRCVFSLINPDGSDATLFFDDTRAFGKLLLATDEILAAWPFWRELGPEPLDLETNEFFARLTGSRAIKAALLDQKVIAGIGNIYADEALFGAGVNPLRAACELSAKESARLLKSIKKVLTLSISQCGSSIRDYRDADGNVGSFQNTFAVYGRGGEKCRKCGSILKKTRVGGRATVFCELCQPYDPA